MACDIKSKVGGIFQNIESRVGAEDIKLLLLIGDFQAGYFVFPDSLVAWKGEHL